MNFQPKTEQQIIEEGLNPAGVYSFEVVDAKEQVSKSGNEMIVLNLRLFDAQGDSAGFVNDYLLESIAYKLRHAAVACGLTTEYEAGTLDASSMIGKSGELKLGIQKDKAGKYPDQNVVKDYVVPKAQSEGVDAPPDVKQGPALGDDQIPF